MMTSFNGPPEWIPVSGLALCFATGIGLGLVYFGILWWNARQLAAGGRAWVTIALMIGRLALLGGLLVLASRQGALPLLAMALGILVARSLALRRVRAAA